MEEDGSFAVEKVLIPHPKKKEKASEEEKIPDDLAGMLPGIMREIGAGRFWTNEDNRTD